MKINVVGWKRIDFTNDQGQRVSGYHVFCPQEIDQLRGQGVEFAKLWLPETWSPFTGDGEAEYNLRGKIVSLTPVKK